MMAQTNAGRTSGRPKDPYGNKPKLEVSHFGGKQGWVCTVESAEWANMKRADASADDWKLVLTYREFPGLEHIINKTGYKSLVQMLPEVKQSEEEWIGERVPLIVKQTSDPRTGEEIEKVWIANPKQWEQAMKKVGKK